MEYSVNKLSKLSGVSARTLRYYDEIGLLKPTRVASSGYRIYGQNEIDRLQQILFYKELEFPLNEIKLLLAAPDFDKAKAFSNHLDALQRKRKRLDGLISNVRKSIAAMEGAIIMADNEKFESFKQNLLEENEAKYGREIREKYGDAAVTASNARLQGMREEQYQQSEALRLELEKALKAAFDAGDPTGALAYQAVDLHRQWLCIFYPAYSKAYHKGLGEMYVADERFRANYDKIAPGCTEFLRDAIHAYCDQAHCSQS